MLKPNKTTGCFLLMLGLMFVLSAVYLATMNPPALRTGLASGCVGLILIVWGSKSFKE